MSKEMPNLTGLSKEQLLACKNVYDGVISVLRRFETMAAKGECAAVPPFFILNTAMRAILSGAKHWDEEAKDLLGNGLAASCATEEEAIAAVRAAFEGRRLAETISGVDHGPGREEKPS